MSEVAPPIMCKDQPGFEKCLAVFETWCDHRSLDFDSDRIDLMKKNKNPSIIYDNFFTQEEFDELLEYTVNNPIWHLIWKGGSSLTNINSDLPNYEKIMNLTVDKIKKIRGDFLIDNMFVRRATNSLPLHTDHVYNFKDRVPTATYLIPLAVEIKGKMANTWDNVSTVMLEQYQYSRAYGADIFAVEGKTDKSFPEEFYNYMSHHSKDDIFGLSVETIINWKPRSMVEMDAYRLHCSNDWKKHGIDAKWGLIIQTADPIPKS